MHSADPICFLAGRTSVRRPGPVSAPLARLRIRAFKGIFSSVPFNSVIPYALRYVVGWLEWLVLVALEIVFGELCRGQRGICDLYAVTSAFSDGDVAAPTRSDCGHGKSELHNYRQLLRHSPLSEDFQ